MRTMLEIFGIAVVSAMVGTAVLSSMLFAGMRFQKWQRGKNSPTRKEKL